MERFLVGRQPIFDAERRVLGYRFPFREADGQVVAGDALAVDALLRSGLNLGIEAIVGSKFASVRATPSLLSGEQPVPLPGPHTVIEVHEDLAHAPETLDGCRRLVAGGYRIALEDYLWSQGDEPLLEVADIVKLDVASLPALGVATSIEHCASKGVRLVAANVETPEMFEHCEQLGFDLFQGYLLLRPLAGDHKTLSPNRLACLRVIDRLSDPDSSAKDVEEIVEADVGLSERFLTAAGEGSALGLRRAVSSIREGVVLFGERRLRSWITLMLLADTCQVCSELIRMAMTRARMSELLADISEPDKGHSAFTVGLVSALDLVLGIPLEDIVTKLALTPELVDALLGNTGPLGGILSVVRAWEQGGDGLAPRSDPDLRKVEISYVKALAWSTATCAILETEGSHQLEKRDPTFTGR